MAASWQRTLYVFIPGFLIGVACTRAPSKWIESKEDPKVGEKVIYGDDNRRDVFEEPDASLRMVSEATAGILRTDALTKDASGLVTIKTRKFGDAYALCPEEPFREQETAPYCSAFLVSPDTLVTAGHCLATAADCGVVSFVFGFSLATSNASLNQVPESDIYRCSRVVFAQVKDADFSVVKLDRPVIGRAPLNVRRQGAISVGDDLVVIGHPSGLPTKIAAGAKVRRIATGFFQSNLDTYGGNSGSVVINARTHEAEGILVRGERDFVLKPDGKCMVSNRCADDQCRGEDVTTITEVLKYLD